MTSSGSQFEVSALVVVGVVCRKKTGKKTSPAVSQK